VAVRRERGRWLRDGQGRPVLVTLHPAALLRTDPADRAAAYDAWLDDLRQAAPHAVPDPGDPMGIPVDSAGTTPHLPTGR
jgi:DNA polymerase